jgi:predicted GTPase
MIARILSQWRSWILALLFAGPAVASMLLGMIWLWERGWLLVGTAVWVASGTLFAILASRWTKQSRPILPPLDWSTPNTFTSQDQGAWSIVEEEARAGEELAMDSLIGADVYIETGRRLLKRLSHYYHPESTHPLEQIPLVELLTALELAAEDLTQISRQIPGGDLITLAHWQRARQVAGYISKANDLYAYVSPLFNPIGGLARIGSRELLMKPAWRDMQRNLLRWFYQAYVNRLGLHLVELMSGRLAIGAEQYRMLTTRAGLPALRAQERREPLRVVVAGAIGSGKTQVIQAIQSALAQLRPTAEGPRRAQDLDPTLLHELQEARWIELPGYPANPSHPSRPSRRERQARRTRMEAAVHGDLVLLTVDGRRGLQPGDVEFANEWDRFFLDHPRLDPPPAVVVVSHVDHDELGTPWAPPYDWNRGAGPREATVQQLFQSFASTLPPSFAQFSAVGISDASSYGVVEHLLPILCSLTPRAVRSALLRKLHEISSRSRLGRVLEQLGRQGRLIWTDLRKRRGESPATR